MDFVADMYKELENFSSSEKFGLTSQLQRAAVSIPSNIAEGAARKNTRELLQFLHVARGSIGELDTQLEICLRIGHLNRNSYEKLTARLDEIGKMLNGLIASLARKL